MFRFFIILWGCLLFISSALGADRKSDLLRNHESQTGCRIGVCLINTADGSTFGYRSNERFALNSTFKALLVADVLTQNPSSDALQKMLYYEESDLVQYSPVTKKHLNEGITVEEACKAALWFSDNTAANLLLDEIGGPSSLTQYIRSLGDATTRLDSWETELNTHPSGDLRDTTTPEAMAGTLHKVLLGDGLLPAQRTQLVNWMKDNKTGGKRIRAALPEGWIVADKTGTGPYGRANDIAVVWPPESDPVVLVIYTDKPQYEASSSNEAIVETAKIVLGLK